MAAQPLLQARAATSLGDGTFGIPQRAASPYEFSTENGESRNDNRQARSRQNQQRDSYEEHRESDYGGNDSFHFPKVTVRMHGIRTQYLSSVIEQDAI
jgi:hypothetical protein